MPTHQKIARITGEDNLQKAFEDLFHVMVNLRIAEKEFEKMFGRNARDKKKYWEEKSDKLIQDLVDGKYVPLNNPIRNSEKFKTKDHGSN